MGVEFYQRILGFQDSVVLVCNTTDVAFGPVFSLPDGVEPLFTDVREYVEAFLHSLPMDARRYSEKELICRKQQFEADCRTKAAALSDQPPKPKQAVRCSICGEPLDVPVLCSECNQWQTPVIAASATDTTAGSGPRST